MSRETIRETAVVTNVTDKEVTLEVCTPEACHACNAKNICNQSGGGKTREITLLNDGQGYTPGDHVVLVMRHSAGFLAVGIAYLIPVFLLIGTLLGLQWAGFSDITSGLVSLLVVILYYLIIRLVRSRVEPKLTIEIEK